MLPLSPLDRQLPLRFRNGVTISRFSKPCVACGQMVQAQQMLGIIRLIDDHLALAAKAHCPHCAADFAVSCVITDDKRVRRIAMPGLLWRFYLRLIPLQENEQARAPAPDEDTPRSAALPLTVTPPAQDYPRADTVIGHYQGQAIPAYIVVDGQQLPFDRIELQGQVGPDEYLLDQRLVYKSR